MRQRSKIFVAVAKKILTVLDGARLRLTVISNFALSERYDSLRRGPCKRKYTRRLRLKKPAHSKK